MSRRAYLDVVSESEMRRLIAEGEAARAALGDVDIDDLPAFGSDVGPGLTDDEVDATCNAIVIAHRDATVNVRLKGGR